MGKDENRAVKKEAKIERRKVGNTLKWNRREQEQCLQKRVGTKDEQRRRKNKH